MTFEVWAAIIGLAIIVPAVLLFNRLVAARNVARQEYVTRIESFPDVLIARMFGFRPMPFFEV